jgi:Ala-tRNA(Pro) deacylase
MNVQQFLNQRHVAFETLDHRPTYNAQRLAQVVHVPGNEVAKAVLLQADDGYVLAVLPATRSVDLERAREAAGARTVELATEPECAECFPDCELGALPPFGSRYGLKTLVDRSLLEDEQIVFEGNTHHEAIRMKLRDYMELEKPLLADFSHPF